ncbi:uncharacterized protein LOC132269405 [Cornus florida]|uniref:uncharacterized protein LOC132269405 n=1 Tax=Cornus florida TaxID=4283 RepID=UPI0028A119DC|nr:uncharacterized protein LOC132269405 [Cornus florida]XP_059626573.1 uncharacterized protein LOC132269405 [Cornus florida]
MAQLSLPRFRDSPKTPRARTSPTVEQLLQVDSSRWPSSTSPTLGKDYDQEEDHAHHNKKSVLAKVKEKAKKLRHSLSNRRRQQGHDDCVTPTWGVSLDDYEDEEDNKDAEYLGAPMYESELAPDQYKEKARQQPRAVPMASEKHVLPISDKHELEEEKEKPPTPKNNIPGPKNKTPGPNNKTISETVSEKLAPAYAAVSDATQTITSKIAGLTIANPKAPETKEDAASGTQKSGRALETKEHTSGGHQTWDKGVSVKEYLMNKLEPGEDERALSQVITEAISPKKTSSNAGVVEKVREAMTSLLHSGEYTQSPIKTATSSSPIPVSTNACEVVEEENQGRILQAN